MDFSKNSYKREKYNSNSDTQKRIRELMAERKLARNSLAETENRPEPKGIPTTSTQLKLQLNDQHKVTINLERDKTRLQSELDKVSRKLSDTEVALLDTRMNLEKAQGQCDIYEKSLVLSNSKLEDAHNEIRRLHTTISEFKDRDDLNADANGPTSESNQPSKSNTHTIDGEVRSNPDYIRHILDSNVRLKQQVDQLTVKLELSDSKLRITFVKLHETESRLSLQQSRIKVLEMQATTYDSRFAESLNRLALAKIEIAELKNGQEKADNLLCERLDDPHSISSQNNETQAADYSSPTKFRSLMASGQSQARFHAPKILTAPTPQLQLQLQSLVMPFDGIPPCECAKCGSLEAEITSLRSNLQSMKAVLGDAQKDLKSALNSSNDKDAVMSVLSANLEVLKAEISDLENERSAMEEKRYSMELSHGNEIRVRDGQIDALQLQLLNLINDSENLKRTLGSSQIDYQQLQSERDAAVDLYNKEVVAGEGLMKQIEGLHAEVRRLTEALSYSRANNSHLEEELRRVTDESTKSQSSMLEGKSGKCNCCMFSRRNNEEEVAPRINSMGVNSNGIVGSFVNTAADSQGAVSSDSDEESKDITIALSSPTLLESERRLLAVEHERSSLKRQLKRALKQLASRDLRLGELEKQIESASQITFRQGDVTLDADSLKEELTSSQERCRELEKQLSASVTKYTEIEVTAEKLSHDFRQVETDCEARLSLLESAFIVQKNRLSTVSSGLIKDNRHRKNELDAKYIAQDDEIRLLRDEMSRAEGRYQSLENDIVAERKEMLKLRTEQMKDRLELSRCQSNYQTLERTLENANTESNRLSCELQSCKNIISELESRLRNRAEVIDDCTRELTSLRSTNTSLEKRLELVTKQRDISYSLVGETSDSTNRMAGNAIIEDIPSSNQNGFRDKSYAHPNRAETGNQLNGKQASGAEEYVAVVESLSKQLMDKDEKLSQAVGHASSLEEQVLEKDAELSELSNMMRTLKNEMADKLSESSSALVAKTVELDKLRALYLSKDDDMATQRSQMEETNAKLASLQLELNNMRTSLGSKDNEIASYKEQIQSLESSLSDQTKVSDALGRRLDDAERNVVLNQMEHRNKQFMDRSPPMKGKPQTFSSLMSERPSTPSTSGSRTPEGSRITKQPMLATLSDRRSGELTAARNQVEALQEELLKTQIRAGNAEKELLYLKKKLAKWSQDEVNQAVGQTLSDLEEKNSRLQREVDRLYEELQRMTAKESRSVDHQLDNALVSDVFAQLRVDKRDLEDRLTFAEDMNTQLSARINQCIVLEATLKDREEQIKQANHKIQLLEHERDRSSHTSSNGGHESDRLKALEQEVIRVKKENASLTTSLRTLQELQDASIAQLEMYSSKCAQQETASRKQIQELSAALEAHNDRFRVMNESSREAIGRLRTLESRCNELEIINAQLQKHRSDLQLHCAELENIVGQLRKREANLEDALHSSQNNAQNAANKPTKLERKLEELEGRLQTMIVEKGEISRQAEERIAHSLAAVVKLDKMLNEAEDLLEKQTAARKEVEMRLAEALNSADDGGHKQCQEAMLKLDRQIQMERDMRLELEKQLQMRNSEAIRRGPHHLAQFDEGVPMHQLEERVNDLEMQLLSERTRRQQLEAWSATAANNSTNLSSAVSSRSVDKSGQLGLMTSLIKPLQTPPRSVTTSTPSSHVPNSRTGSVLQDAMLRPDAGATMGMERHSSGERSFTRPFNPKL